jgi:carboxypeptidase family protein/TonB-dependent receptor-like protein
MKTKIWTIVLLLSTATMWAQTFRGSLTGTVVDTNGAAVAGATISAKSPDTGLTRTATTDDQGVYVINELPLGLYSLTISHSGFGTQTLTGISVGVGSNPAVNASLKPGTVEEQVTVTADVPLVETTSNILGGTLDAKQAEQLPVNGRDFIKLLTMVPGSTADASGVSDSPGAFGQFSVNGNRGRSNNYLLDGTDMNDGYRNDSAINEAGVFGTPATLLPIDALTEVSIMSSTEAEYGRNSGAIVNIVTKSGTNNWHGSLFEYFRNNWLDARNAFNTTVDASGTHQPQDEFRNNQFGGSLGGPIFRDKTFFFLAYEGQREVIGIPTVSTVPSQAEITALGGATNVVAANILALKPWGPLPAVGNTSAGPTGPADVTQSNKSTNYLHSLIFKVDQHVGQGDLLTGRYFYGTSVQSFPLALVEGSGLPGYNTVTPTDVHVLSLSYTHVFSPRLLMENRFGWNSFDEDFLPQDNTLDPNSLGLDTGVKPFDFGLPQLTFGDGISTVGATTSVPRGRVDRNWQYFTNVSYSNGRHNWKFGGEWRRTTVQQVFDSGFRSKLNFADLPSFLAGIVDSGRQATEVSSATPTTLFSGTTDRHTAQNNWAFYFQDSWRALPRLTVNYGLRWDYFGVIHEAKGQFSNFNFSPTAPAPVLTNQLYPKDLNNFGPRLSLAWDVFGSSKTVVRAGWGLYYDAFSQDFFIGQLPFNTFNPGPAYNGVGPNQTLFSFSPTGTLTPGVPVFDPSTFSASDVFTVDPNIRTPYVQNYNLNIEQQLGTHAALQVGYVGSMGRKLFRYVDRNQCVNTVIYGTFAPGTCFPDGAPELGSPFGAAGFEYVNQFQSSSNSSYNALQMTFRIKEWRGFTSTVNYTWSHAIDNASDGQDFIAQATQPDNSFRPDLERSNATFDTRNRFNWNFNYEFPKSTRMPWLLSGWGLDGVLTLMNGQPFNPTYQFEGDFNGSGEFFGRPDIFGNPNGTSDFNQANLAVMAAPCLWDTTLNGGDGGCVPGTQHFGNLGRNALQGPSFKNFDLSFVKDTKLGERISMQLRADVFNIFNHPNFTNPTLPNFAVDMFANGSAFVPTVSATQGRLTGVGFLNPTATPDVGIGNPFLGGGGPRNIQLAVKFTF